ncbi:MlaD family protein [Gordonia hydrophobica]|uniref:MlaD family protein n=1 Tax=Gordonia hydrophobica TaxID=40516 RepID=A0ABZ2U2Z0_9ACTN|nr:MlaD family protein [Gordonia hydrophobica]MBM7367366.1 virulence factor Mce-like protein [Gordonia hydrophobica]
MTDINDAVPAPRASRLRRRVFGALAVTTAVAIGVTATGFGFSSAATTSAGTGGGDGFCVDFTDAIGLYEGNPVTQMGVKVGSVTQISAHGPRVRVTFSLDSGRAYPATVKAVTRSKSLLADRSLELVGNYATGPVLEAGHCISMQNSFTPKPISEVAGSASDFLEGLSANGGDDLQRALSGADLALDGTGAKANSMFRNAADAAKNPDAFTADIGASIADMAPLTDAALKHWEQIMSLADQGASVASLGTGLFYKVAKFCRGIGWTIALMYDVWKHYGPELEKIVLDVGSPVVSAIAGNAPTWRTNLKSLTPAIGDALRDQTAATGALSVPYQAPSVTVSAQQCKALGKACKRGTNQTTSVNPIDLVLKAGAK